MFVYIYAVSLFAQLVYRLVNGPLALRMPRRLLLLPVLGLLLDIYFVAGVRCVRGSAVPTL